MSDDDDDRKPITIAHVQAEDPPGQMTIDRWLKWRDEETKRMIAEALAQVQAYFERERGGETLH